jgi:hypothetical protein
MAAIMATTSWLCVAPLAYGIGFLYLRRGTF